MSTTAKEWKIEALPRVESEVKLPDIISAEQFLRETWETPTELVEGLIHRNTVTSFSGGSKSFKTFIQMDLGLSVSQGQQWWGRQVVQGRVLYVNFEIAPGFFHKRLAALMYAKSIERPKDFDVWNLRGYAADARDIIPKIIERCTVNDYSMIILDPIYKLMGARSENAANEMAEFLNYFERLSNQTGAAVVYNHHFAKGLASNKDHIDRASGSGVFARHADGIITLTAHEEKDAFTFEATLRNFPPVQAFVLRWDYPLMTPDYDADPRKLKNRAGAKPKYSVADVMSFLTDGMTSGEWKAAAKEACGLAPSTFATWKNKALSEHRVELRGKAWFRKHKVVSLNPLTNQTTIRDAAAAN